jgi:hypothetical protein
MSTISPTTDARQQVRARATNWLTAILALSVLARLAAALYLGNTVEVLPGTFDQVSYHALALRVLSGHGFSFAQFVLVFLLEKTDAIR